MEIFNTLESEVRGYIRSFPVVFDTAEGSQMVDEDGKTYLDFFAGAGTLNYGHNPEKATAAMIEHLTEKRVVHGLDKATKVKRSFMETFNSLILEPRNLEYKFQFTGPTGTNATETAMKLARIATGRSTIVAFTNGYHGHTMGALAVTGNESYRDESYDNRGSVSHMPFDGFLGDMDTLRVFERYLEDSGSGLDTPAAVIVETVQGEGGIKVASTEWLQKLEKLCRKYEILLIIDDIQVGNGRTGKFFSFEEAGIVPDMVCLSKSLGGGLPMALLLFRPDLDKWEPGQHTGTFRGNNLAFAASVQLLQEYWADDSFEKEIFRKGELMRSRLQKMADKYPEHIAEIRGRGMVWGIEMKNPADAGTFSKINFSHNLITETCGSKDDVLKLLPALTISDELLNEGLDIMEKSLSELVGGEA
ncbi:diaminobutyrate--2-oxoglutarate transaminase [Chitinivibrio alkaliphilus]|uniref:Diaminobutyrate--2-oxoglutarate transaminase n=1 Tax=Chitinivibrio alkaliphilus ACht1 TaxID=1313304 RepID=U7D831_9BACT|nr:diaminobutyrate--2-oxoglutarate transaminase [Chitinivibrio alkaliphilus]ERP31731.1 L-2,4-diaminobutyric acid transaminase [Chitinivibrio alkaliphilus ACht1]